MQIRAAHRSFASISPIAICAVLSASLAHSPAALAQSTSVVVTGATVIDVRSGSAQPRDILLRDGRIAEVGPRGAFAGREPSRSVDASGLYAIPGLWDMHIHVTNEPELRERMPALLIANGITNVRDMGGALERVRAFREFSRREDTVAPRAWISGPLIDGAPPVRPQPRAPSGFDTVPDARTRLNLLIDNDVDFIKVYEMLRPEVLAAIVGRAHAHRLKVTGHIPIRMTTDAALAAGLDGIEHLRGMEFDCAADPQRLLAERVAIMDAHHPESGGMELRRKVHETIRPQAFSQQDPARCAALIRKFAERGTWHTPTLNIVAFRALRFYEDPRRLHTLRYLSPALQSRWRARLAEYADEAQYADWQTLGEWALRIAGEMHRAGVPLLAGTDAPALPMTPGFTLHDELEALVLAGLSPLAALQAATVAPAQFFGITADFGAIEPGKRADLVLLEANPLDDIRNSRRIAVVIAKGRVHDRAALDAMLAALETKSERPN